jgi:hypothetical protein
MSFTRRLLLQGAAAPFWLPAATSQFPDKLPFRALFLASRKFGSDR